MPLLNIKSARRQILFKTDKLKSTSSIALKWLHKSNRQKVNRPMPLSFRLDSHRRRSETIRSTSAPLKRRFLSTNNGATICQGLKSLRFFKIPTTITFYRLIQVKTTDGAATEGVDLARRIDQERVASAFRWKTVFRKGNVTFVIVTHVTSSPLPGIKVSRLYHAPSRIPLTTRLQKQP
jgi:hypothetical protein